MVNNRLRDKRGDDAGCPPVSGSVKGGSVIRAQDREIARDGGIVGTAFAHYECVSIRCRSDILARVGLERNVESATTSRSVWVHQPRKLVGRPILTSRHPRLRRSPTAAAGGIIG